METIDQFKTWLSAQGVSDNSVNSYGSYLRNVAEEASSNGFDIFQVPQDEDAFEDYLDELSNLIDGLTARISEASDEKQAKIYNNWRSALRKYRNYLLSKKGEYRESTEPIVKQVEEDAIVNDSISDREELSGKEAQDNTKSGIYTHNDLKNIFKGRLKSQERTRNQKKVAWFIRIIHYILCTGIKNYPSVYTSRGIDHAILDIIRKSYEIDLDNLVLRAILHTEIGTITLAQVKELTITPNGEVYVTLNHPKATGVRVLTEFKLPKPLYRDLSVLVPLFVSSSQAIDEIVLDHIYRMEDLLDDLESANQLPVLERITDMVRKNKIDISNITDPKSSAFWDYVIAHLVELFHEVQLVNGRVVLQLMHEAQNSGKH
jgi:ElaB/YqjD/DUF883 family membrane-anchored ribosome-binding protein